MVPFFLGGGMETRNNTILILKHILIPGVYKIRRALQPGGGGKFPIPPKRKQTRRQKQKCRLVPHDSLLQILREGNQATW